jgi:hypothetical protein
VKAASTRGYLRVPVNRQYPLPSGHRKAGLPVFRIISLALWCFLARQTSTYLTSGIGRYLVRGLLSMVAERKFIRWEAPYGQHFHAGKRNN